MHEKINVDFKMNINNEGQIHTVQFKDEGKLYFNKTKTYIKFKEPSFEGDDFNNLTLICDNKEIVIIRHGFVNMNQKYKLNEYTKGIYKNELITSEITTYTNHYKFSLENILLNYDLFLDEKKVGNYQMEIDIKGVGKNE